MFIHGFKQARIPQLRENDDQDPYCHGYPATASQLFVFFRTGIVKSRFEVTAIGVQATTS